MSESIVKISKNEQTNAYSYTISFEWDVKAKPGQFVMVYAPGMEEIPLSLSSVDDIKAITFKVIGNDTRFLSNMKEGDNLRIRGPYGNGYDLSSNKILAIGGGIGIAPLTSAIKTKKMDAIFAARDAAEVSYSEPLGKKYCNNYWICTDDGSIGCHCNAVEMTKKVLSENEYDMIIACGPEIMLFFLSKALDDLEINYQMSLERYMKCGAGICGACMIDDRRVCKDGPVFTKTQIKTLKEFGTGCRDSCGAFRSFR